MSEIFLVTVFWPFLTVSLSFLSRASWSAAVFSILVQVVVRRVRLDPVLSD